MTQEARRVPKWRFSTGKGLAGLEKRGRLLTERMGVVNHGRKFISLVEIFHKAQIDEIFLVFAILRIGVVMLELIKGLEEEGVAEDA